MPFFRAHSHKDFSKREPWLYHADEQSIIRDSIALRYKLFFVIQDIFREYTKEGVPIVRPLYLEYPQDKE